MLYRIIATLQYRFNHKYLFITLNYNRLQHNARFLICLFLTMIDSF